MLGARRHSRPLEIVVIVGRRRGDAVRVEARFITRSTRLRRLRRPDPACRTRDGVVSAFVPAGKIAIGSGDLTLRLPEGPG